MTAVVGVVSTVGLGGPRAMRAMQLLRVLVREYTSRRTRIALVAIFDAKWPLVVIRCGAVMVERRAMGLVRDYEQEGGTMA